MQNGNSSDNNMDKETSAGIFKKYRIDIIVVASLLLVSVIVLLAVSLWRKEGARVRIEIDGELLAEYPLAIDAVYRLNGGTNELTIKDGLAYMSYSDCPDHTCENTGRVRMVGQTIICLPNRISITVVGESDDYVDFVP